MERGIPFLLLTPTLPSPAYADFDSPLFKPSAGVSASMPLWRDEEVYRRSRPF